MAQEPTAPRPVRVDVGGAGARGLVASGQLDERVGAAPSEPLE